jgi:hypothetical protein
MGKWNKDRREMAIYFVGREKETRQMIKALKRGDNVILMGKYGIGRTSLTRHVAEIGRHQWNFISLDFSQTPAKVCNHLADHLLPKKDGEAMAYRQHRFRIANLVFDGQRQSVLVLDDIGKLSPQKVELIRYLAMAKRFRFVAVVENFLKADKPTREFFRHYSLKHYFGWTEGEISSLAEMSGGYPLGMKEVVARRLARPRNWEAPAFSVSGGPGARGSVSERKSPWPRAAKGAHPGDPARRIAK